MEILIEKICRYLRQNIDTIVKLVLGLANSFISSIRKVLQGGVLKLSPSNIVLYNIEIKISQLPKEVRSAILNIAKVECAKKKCESTVTYNDRKNIQIILTKYQYLIMMLFSKEFIISSAIKVKVATMLARNKREEVRPMILQIIEVAKKKKAYKLELKQTCESLLLYF